MIVFSQKKKKKRKKEKQREGTKQEKLKKILY